MLDFAFKMKHKLTVVIIFLIVITVECNYKNATRTRHHSKKRIYRPKFTVDELLTKTFVHKISNDIYLDPCKSGN